MAATLNVTYAVYDDSCDTEWAVREGEVEGMTEIRQIEYVGGTKKEVAYMSIANEHLPLMIEALRRRYADAKDGER